MNSTGYGRRIPLTLLQRSFDIWERFLTYASDLVCTYFRAEKLRKMFWPADGLSASQKLCCMYLVSFPLSFSLKTNRDIISKQTTIGSIHIYQNSLPIKNLPLLMYMKYTSCKTSLHKPKQNHRYRDSTVLQIKEKDSRPSDCFIYPSLS
jgi:hypothetical protein